jgi:hypothetical protein
VAFLVEDGTGLAGATSYISVANFKLYCADIGTVLTSYTDAQIEQALVRTTKAIDAKGINRFVGAKGTAAQALAWPRTDATDVYGFDLADDAIPVYVTRAACEGGIAELASVGSLQASLDRGGMVQEERVEGAVTVRYFNGAPSGTVYTAFISALAPVMSGSGGNISVMRV